LLKTPPKLTTRESESTYGVWLPNIPQLIELKKNFPSRMLEDRSTRFPASVKSHGSTRENCLFITVAGADDIVRRRGTDGCCRWPHGNGYLQTCG
jgi:hypothetical protein